MKRLTFALCLLPGLAQAQSYLGCPEPDGGELWHKALCELGAEAPIRPYEFLFDAPPSIWNAQQFKTMAFLDWEAETEEVLAWFDEMLLASGAASIDPATRADFLGTGRTSWGDSTPLNTLSVPLAQYVADQGLCLLYIETGSDSYGFAVTTQALYARWVAVDLGADLSLDPVSDDVQRVSYTIERRNSPRTEEEASDLASQGLPGCKTTL